jgi:hypothetical protein
MLRGLILMLLAVPSLAGAVPTRVTGTLVDLDPPPGFTRMERYPGFENRAKEASIMVSELPGSTAEVRKGMTRENLAGRGMILLTTQTVVAGGKSALLLQVSQRAAGREFLKWMLVTGDTKKSVMIVGSFPKASPALSAPIKRALLSAKWSPSGPSSNFDGLTFRVDPAPKLKLGGRVGNLLVFSESGKIEPSNTTEAMLIVGSSYAEASVTDVEAFAKERASKTTRIGPLKIIEGRSVTTDGLPGYEIVANTYDLKSSQDIRMYQLVLADKTTYYLAQGFVTPQRAAAVLPQFRLVTGSFRRVRPTR